MAKFHKEYSMAQESPNDMKTCHKLLFFLGALLVIALLLSVFTYLIQSKEGGLEGLIANSSLSPHVQDYKNQHGGDSQYCLEPISVSHGEWFCKEIRTDNEEVDYNDTEDGSGIEEGSSSSVLESFPVLRCNLECWPGYTHTQRSFTSCSRGEWTKLPSQMNCTEAFSLITGGYSKEQSVEIYPSPEEIYPNQGVNVNFPPLPDLREDHTVDRVDGITLLCGGSQAQTVKTCLKFSLEDKKFYPHSTLTRDRMFHSSVVFGQKLLLIGGGDNKMSALSSVSTEFLYPWVGKEWMPGHNLSELTEFACSVKVSRDSYVVIGGSSSEVHSTFKYSNHVIQYNITDGDSKRLPDLPSGKNAHGCVLVKNGTQRGILVAGGHSNDADLPVVTTQMLNLDTLMWEEMGRLHVGRYELGMVVLGERILVMGGKDKDHNLIKSVEQFDIKQRKWKKVEDLKQKRSKFALTTIPQCYLHRNGC